MILLDFKSYCTQKVIQFINFFVETFFFTVIRFLDVDEEYKARVAYVINSKHSYEFEVRAKITQVLLKLNKQ